jgi:hypothetical protein
VLDQGSVPLPMLERAVDDWLLTVVDATRTQAAVAGGGIDHSKSPAWASPRFTR